MFERRPAAGAEGPLGLAELLPTVINDRAMASLLGAAYLRQADSKRLDRTLERLRQRGPTSVAILHSAVAELAREDLARRQTVVVEGWVLARAEAETLALIHLSLIR
jgi:hypothetical protein